MKRKTKPEWVELKPEGVWLTQFCVQKKFKYLSLLKIYIAFEEPILLHAGKEGRLAW